MFWKDSSDSEQVKKHHPKSETSLGPLLLEILVAEVTLCVAGEMDPIFGQGYIKWPFRITLMCWFYRIFFFVVVVLKGKIKMSHRKCYRVVFLSNTQCCLLMRDHCCDFSLIFLPSSISTINILMSSSSPPPPQQGKTEQKNTLNQEDFLTVRKCQKCHSFAKFNCWVLFVAFPCSMSCSVSL